MEDGEMEQHILIGRIVRPHGLAGAVVVDPETDFGETRFRRGARVWVTPAKGQPVKVTVGSSRPQGDRWIVQFEGRATVEDAESWRDATVSVEGDALAPLPAGQYYLHDLVGCTVQTADGQVIGPVAVVYTGAAQAVLGITGPSGEILVPMAGDICREVDIASRRITIVPPDGLLEVNAT
jgi:16S rRNA processing protein RimM